MNYKETTPSQISDKDLIKCILTPLEDKMPQDLKTFLKGCEIEFKRRKITLKSIMK